MPIMFWVLIFVMLMPNGELNHVNIGLFETLEECYYVLDEMVVTFPETESMNWDLVCLQDPAHRA